MTQWLIRQMRAKTATLDTHYAALKKLDPYHPAVGAIESYNMFAFTTKNEWIPGPSLDVLMFENYVPRLSDDAHTATSGDFGTDGGLDVWPLTWEPVVNCPGPYRVARERPDIDDAEKSLTMYSLSWLSAVLARAPHQLHFRLFASKPHSDPIYEAMEVQVGHFGSVAAAAREFLFQPPSGLPEPRVEPLQPGLLRARIWRRSAPASPDRFCALLVVVNTNSSNVSETFVLKQADRWPSASQMRLRRIDGPGDVAFSDGRAVFGLAPSDTHVYMMEEPADCELSLFV